MFDGSGHRDRPPSRASPVRDGHSDLSLIFLFDAVIGYQAVVILVGILDGLDAQKDRAEKHRQHDHHHLHVPVALLSVVNRQRHRQAADDQNKRVEPAPERIEMITAGGKRHRKLRTKDQISREQARRRT